MNESMVLRHALVSIFVAVAFAAVLVASFALNPWLAWLIGITAATLLTFGYDKVIAGSKWTRVPEVVLLLLTGMGGTLGATVGMFAFHHKTSKASFQMRFWLIVLLQIILIVTYLVWVSYRP